MQAAEVLTAAVCGRSQSPAAAQAGAQDAAAFYKAAGIALKQPWRFDGRTELAAAGALRAHGLDPDDGQLDTFTDLLVMEHRTRAGDLAADGHVLPGAANALTGGRTPAGVYSRVAARLLALAAAIWQNWRIGAPVMRSLTDRDH